MCAINKNWTAMPVQEFQSRGPDNIRYRCVNGRLGYFPIQSIVQHFEKPHGGDRVVYLVAAAKRERHLFVCSTRRSQPHSGHAILDHRTNVDVL